MPKSDKTSVRLIYRDLHEETVQLDKVNLDGATLLVYRGRYFTYAHGILNILDSSKDVVIYNEMPQPWDITAIVDNSRIGGKTLSER